MSRITWQNVVAPDMGTAMRAAQASTDNLRAGIGDMTGIVDGMIANRDRTANNEALEQMLTHQDVGSWDRALASGGFAALGIDPSMASNDLINAMMGRRDVLHTNRVGDQAHYETRYDQGRQELADRRSDEQFARDQTAADLLKWGREQADQMAVGAENQDDMIRGIMQMDIPLAQRDALLAGARGVDAAHWAVDPNFRLDDNELLTVFADSDRISRDQQHALDNQYGVNSTLRIMGIADEMKAQGSTAAPVQQVIDRLGISAVTDEDGNLTSEFEESRGETARLFNNLSAEFKHVNPETIAAAMTYYLDGTGPNWWQGTNMSFLESDIRAELETLNTPEGYQLQRERADNYTRQQQSIAAPVQQLQSLQARYMAEASNPTPNPQRLAQLREEILKVGQQVRSMPPIQGVVLTEAEERARATRELAAAAAREEEAAAVARSQPYNDAFIANTLNRPFSY